MMYKFEAMTSTGMEVSDVIAGDSEVDAEHKIRQMGYFCTKICKVKPNKDDIKVVYSDVCKRNYWKMAFFALLASVLVLWFMALSAQGQEKESKPTLQAGIQNGLFQEIVMEHDGSIYCFYRNSSDYRHKPLHWGDWTQRPPYDNRFKSRAFKPKVVDQRTVSAMMGPAMLKHLDAQQRVSGYYNFTKNPLHDWKNFGGDTYGTFTKKRLDFTDKLVYRGETQYVNKQ